MRWLGVMCAAVVLALAGACAKQQAPVSQVHVAAVSQDAKASTFEQVDLGKTGFSIGDELVEVSPVTVGAATTGTAYTVVTLVSGTKLDDASGVIDCHVQLDGGTVLFNGGFAMKDLGDGVDLPVVGGTGKYAGVGGSVKMQVPDQKHTNLTFDLLVPRTKA